MPIKIRGPRSIKAKLERLAAELENDAARIRARADGNTYYGKAEAIKRVASDMRLIARGL